MALKGLTQFKGLEVKEGYVCVAQVYGGARTGSWTANCELYAKVPYTITTAAVMRQEVIDSKVVAESIITPASSRMERGPMLDSFTVSVPYAEGENPYTAIYAAMRERPELAGMSSDKKEGADE